MSRRVLLLTAAVASALLLGVGVLAGVLIASDDGSDSASSSNNGPAYLGARIQDLFGLANVVSAIEKDSPAEKAGLEFGDSITALDGTKIRSSSDLEKALAAKKPGDKVKLDYWRLGEDRSTDVKLGGAPKEAVNERRAGDIEIGTVKQASDKTVVVDVPFSNQDVSYSISKSTRFWKASGPIKASELKEGDYVMIVSVDGGKTALTGLALSK